MVVAAKLSPALTFLSAKSEMLDSGDPCKISLNDNTNIRKQFKTTSGQSSNNSDLFNNPNFDTDSFSEIWHYFAAVLSLLPTNGCFDPNHMPTNQVAVNQQ